MWRKATPNPARIVVRRHRRAVAASFAALACLTGIVTVLPARAGTPAFEPAVTTGLGDAVGNAATITISDDVDNDGDRDLVTANEGSDDVSVLVNDGALGFAEIHNYPVGPDGSSPVDVAAGDLDGDGDADLVTANIGFGLEEISVLLNDGTGAFQSPALVEIPGATTRSVVVADLDADGDRDVALTDDSNNVVHVLMNDGAANLAAPVAYPAGSVPIDLAAADMDGDTLSDLVVLGHSGSVSVLLNTGGVFAAPVTIGVPATDGFLAVGNIDAASDSDLDVVVGSNIQNSVQILVNDGFGNLNLQDTISPVLDGPLTLGDVNGDGSADLVKNESNFPAGDVTVRLSDGFGAFGSPTNFGPVGLMRGLVVDDLDGDADADVAGTATTELALHVVVLANTGGGALGGPSVFGVPAMPFGVASGDVDNDGDVDVVTANLGRKGLSVLLNDGTGAFPDRIEIAAGEGRAVTMGDLTGDGRPELVVASGVPQAIFVFPNTGAGTFGAPLQHPVPGGGAVETVQVADVDGDGDRDVLGVVGPDEPGFLTVLYNTDGAGTLSAPSNFPTSTVQASDVATADFDGDGDLDAAIAGRVLAFGDPVTVLENTGSGAFGPSTPLTGLSDDSRAIVAADLDSDGDVDLAATQNDNQLAVFINDGAGTFAPALLVPAGTNGVDIVAADFDGDGHVDLATANHLSSDVVVVRSLGGGSFDAPVSFPVPETPRGGLTVADFDGDGAPDIVAAGTRSGAVSLLRNLIPTQGDVNSGTIGPGGTVSTGSEATPTDPVETAVTSPNPGMVSIVESSTSTYTPPAEYTFLGTEINITAPDATPAQPLQIEFRIQTTSLLPGQDETNLAVLRNGVLPPVPACNQPPLPLTTQTDPCVSSRAVVGDDVVITVLTSRASIWNLAGPTPPAGDLLLSLDHRQQLPGGLLAQDEDVVRYKAAIGEFDMVFDGSDVGVAKLAVDALALTGPEELVLSFTKSGSVPGLGWVDHSDLVKFVATRLGPTTAGHFEWYLDGSDLGLTSPGEGVDAVEIVGDDIYLSTTGPFSARSADDQVTGTDHDIFVCRDATTGASSACGALEAAFTGGPAGLNGLSEDINGFLLDPVTGQDPSFSTAGRFSAGGATGDNEDVFSCTGSLATCQADPEFAVVFDGSAVGLGHNALAAIEFGVVVTEP